MLGTVPVSQRGPRGPKRAQEPLRALCTIITSKSLSPVIFPVIFPAAVSSESAHLQKMV